MDYSKTLNLPQTEFPMRANLPEREPQTLQYWENIDVYKLIQKKNSGRSKFILHDGPPYANGHLHLGHVLNKVLKDMVVKFKAMDGYDAPYVPGWDTHGLPIEQQAIKQLGLRRKELKNTEFRNRCREYALKFVDIQREEFKRLGVRGDWQNPYLTLEPHFEARQVEVFGEMAKKGYIYKGQKAVYWCASCETALAEAEVEYAEKKSPSIYAAFTVKEGKGIIAEKNTHVVIWTTTPWTIPSNVAICLHPDYQYVLLESGGHQYLVAKDLASVFSREILKNPKAMVMQEFSGADLRGVICKHPFIERDSEIVLDDYVTLEQGTGCVHVAPGHGEEDFAIGQKYDLPVISPIDGKGYFSDELEDFAGQFYLDANNSVLEKLDTAQSLLSQHTIKHQYPHCWRCKKSILYRATEQWFASIKGFRQELLDAIEQVQWIPGWGRERIHGMIANRGDWCISRQRIWGVPIPIFYCGTCEAEIITEETIAHIVKLFEQNGSDIWFEKEASELLPSDFNCPHCKSGNGFTKEMDTMDVWFDSGSSHWAVLRQPEHWPELSWPADLYLEGSDQHRGWFNSSLTTAVAVSGKPPYRAVLTHGFVVDHKGRKMSKSLGNVVDPEKVLKKMGADPLRLWVCSADYRGDLAVSPAILQQLTEAYRKIRNTFRFLLGNLSDFDFAKEQVAYAQLTELDQYALLKLTRVTERVLRAYREYEYHVVYHTLYNYCVTDLSAFYLNIVKDRLYCDPANSISRRAAQTVMYTVLDSLVRMLVPVLAFTTEEVWQHFPYKSEKQPSAQLLDMPTLHPEYLNVEMESRWEMLNSVRQDVLKELEKARKEKIIRDSLEAEITLFAKGPLLKLLQENEPELRLIFVSAPVTIQEGLDQAPANAGEGALSSLRVSVEKTTGDKCQRCWNYGEIGVDSAYPDVCSRCSLVLKSGNVT